MAQFGDLPRTPSPDLDPSASSPARSGSMAGAGEMQAGSVQLLATL